LGVWVLFLLGVLGLFYLFERWQHSNFAPAQGPSSRVIRDSSLRICNGQVAKVTTDPNPKCKRALIHELLGFFLTSGLLPNFRTLGVLFPVLSFFFGTYLPFFCFLPFPSASARGQASEVSWFPGMWVTAFCDSIVQMLIHSGISSSNSYALG